MPRLVPLATARPAPWPAPGRRRRRARRGRARSRADHSSATRRLGRCGGSPSRRPSPGKCSRSSASTSWASRVRSSCMVISRPDTSSCGLSSRRIIAQRLEELDQALERQVLGLDRHDHPVGGGQGVDADRAQRGRAVEQGHREALAHGPEPLAQARLRAVDPRQLDRGAGEVAAGRAPARGCPGPAGRAASATETSPVRQS